MKKVLFILLKTIILTHGLYCYSQSDMTQNIDSIIDANNFNGVILITQDTTTLYKNVTGYSDFETKTKLKFEDQFVIGSISKQITAILILDAYEQKLIKLTDTINKYLPNIKQPWSYDINIHHLLTHTHGIIQMDKSLAFLPGTKFKYSQIGYYLLAQILENIHQKSFQDLCTQLFKTNGLKNTFHPKNKKYTNLTKGFQENHKHELVFSKSSLENYAAAGSMISNTEDLNKWNHLLFNDRLLMVETMNKMKTRYATREHPIFKSIEYGYGLLFKPQEQEIEIGTLGYAPGFVSASYYYPKQNISLVILSNTAKELHDFKLTFKTHTSIMKIIKERSSNN